MTRRYCIGLLFDEQQILLIQDWARRQYEEELACLENQTCDGSPESREFRKETAARANAFLDILRQTEKVFP